MSTTYKTGDGETLELICWQFYGQQSGAVEAVLEANQNLADLGVILPANTVVILPELSQPEAEVQPVRLWD